MAVQAQYSSNVLNFNRNMQEHKNDYSIQPQPIGYIDQSSSQMLFNNGVQHNNPRKRGREINNGAQINAISSLRNPQFIDHELLHGNTHNQQHQNVVSTGLHLSFTDQQLNQNKKQSIFSSQFSENIESQIKQESEEIDHLIQAQGELLRRVLADKMQKRYHTLATATEKSVASRLKEKEVEAEKAKRRNNELESRAAQLSVESQVWQSKIRTQEVTVATLEAQLQHAIMTVNCAYKDKISNCAVDRHNNVIENDGADDAESANIEPIQTGPVVTGPVCKGCWTRSATVVVLPCWHLCVCTDCDNGLRACPVCFTMKSSSVEARFS